jgi:hypothetical protein
MPTYSFLDVQAAISGPGGAFSLGSNAGDSEEGISYEMTEAKNTMTIGAGGDGMHSLHAGKSGRITVRLLKTSPTNAKLGTMYSLQSSSSSLWGINILTIANPQTGDVVTGQQAAFSKNPNNSFAKTANTIEWVFDVILIDTIFGTGSPTAS